jgi:hypothetical protein
MIIIINYVEGGAVADYDVYLGGVLERLRKRRKTRLLNPGLRNTKQVIELVATATLGPYLILSLHVGSSLEGLRYLLPLQG